MSTSAGFHREANVPENSGRVWAAEILDGLPADSPTAQRCRRDLRRLNLLMGNTGWIESTLRRVARPDERILELGAGDGALGLRLALEGWHVEGIDRMPRPAGWPTGSAWHQADLTEFRDWERGTIVLGCLVFHHFDDRALRELGERCRRHARAIIAVEPARNAWSRLGFALACVLLRVHRYTRHDGAVSIAAGFRGDELAHRLGLSPHEWVWRTETTWRGANRLVAERKR